MNCCNHDCNQGRDCPNREPSAAAWPAVLLVAVILAVFAGMTVAMVDANWPVLVAFFGALA